MSRELHKQKLIQFLETIRRLNVSIDTVDEKEGLVQSGLIDSLAILEIVSFLESEFSIDFSETGIDPGQLSSIEKILDLIEQQSS